MKRAWRPPPLMDRVLGGLPFLVVFGVFYLLARCCGLTGK